MMEALRKIFISMVATTAVVTVFNTAYYIKNQDERVVEPSEALAGSYLMRQANPWRTCQSL